MSAVRAGLLIPSSNTTIEVEYYRFGPAGITWHFARLPMAAVTPEEIRAQDVAIDAAARLLADARPSALLLCQSAASFVMGTAYDAAVGARLSRICGCVGLTGAGAMVEALAALGARRVALVTPFSPEVLTMTEAFLGEHGVASVRSVGLAIAANFDIAGIGARTLIAMVEELSGDDVDAIVLPGGNMPCLEHIPAMERVAGRPVVTTNQAGIWAIARRAGVALDRSVFGTLARA